MVAVFPLLYIVWKLMWKTKIVKPEELDLRMGQEGIEEYERSYEPNPQT